MDIRKWHERYSTDCRSRKMDASVAEKLDKNDKNLVSAVIRGIKEELDVDINESQISDNGKNRKVIDSMSYPGLNSIIDLFKYTVILNESQYNPDGYVENQEDKSTYFKWVKNLINEEYKPERNLSNFTPEEVQEIKDIFLDVADEFSMQYRVIGEDDELYNNNGAAIQYNIGCYRNVFIEIYSEGDTEPIARYIKDKIIPRIESIGYKIFNFKFNEYIFCNNIYLNMINITIIKNGK